MIDLINAGRFMKPISNGGDFEGISKAFTDGINLDGGAVTVGYGATPEPASGVLLLLGGALLALRRNTGRRRHA